MGKRIFSGTEQADSCIKWELADPIITKKLCEAIRKKNHGKFGRVIAYLPFVFLLAIFCIFVYVLKSNYLQLQSKRSKVEWIFIICFIIVAVIFFLIFGIFLLKNYIEEIPYLYPEKQENIWIFSAKCTDVTPYYASNNNSHYSAYFQKGNVFIAIRITGYECQNKIPIGKEYLFYKFNDKTGNKWAAIPESLVNI